MKAINVAMFALTILAFSHAAPAADGPKKPVLVGEPWQVAGDPDLGDLNNPKQQPVDFAVWQAADGSWQLWSCIRFTKAPGKTRLFYRWEGANITDANWKPMGVAMKADPKTGELEGGLQAPYVFRKDKQFVMFYGGWDDICSATSPDGKTFTRKTDAKGKATLFGEPKPNPRDPMLLRVGDKWHCYYTAHPDKKGAVYCRTSPDLAKWSDAKVVARGGQGGDGPYSSECPFVVEFDRGHYYLFRNQIYGKAAKCSVYHSRDPLDFGLDRDAGHFVTTLPVAAPEIIRHKDDWYIASLLPTLKGIQITRLKWE
jgi:Glycosyl hydrolases family 32 N-terminal domain